MSLEFLAHCIIIPCFIWSMIGLKKNQISAFGGLFIIGCFGQLGRLFVTPSSIGVLTLDFIIPCFVGFWGILQFVKQRPLPRSYGGGILLTLLSIFYISFLFIIPELPTSELISSFVYLLRYTFYIFLFFIAKDLLTIQSNQEKLFTYFYFSLGLLLLGGIIQFIFVPDFRFIAHKGWDPHIGRLIGTWFDPNYLGGFLVFAASITVSDLLSTSRHKLRYLYVCIFILLAGAIFLTYSRSALLAFIVAISIIGLIKARLLLTLFCMAAMIIIPSNERLKERTIGLWEGAMATITGSNEYMLDITSQKRVESWNEATTIMDNHWLFGVGYNTVTYRKLDKGLIPDTKKHSASGTDASILNVFITSGIFGLLAYILFLGRMFSGLCILYMRSIHKRIQLYALGGIAGYSALFIHSFFVNTLFYPLILIFILPFLALYDTWIIALESSENNTNQNTQHTIS